MSKSELVKTRNSSYEDGFSVMELLISMSIFLIVMSSVYGILRIGNMSRATINTRSETIKKARTALNTIGRDAVNAGLGFNRVGGVVPDDFTHNVFDMPTDSNDDRDLLTSITMGNDISETDLSKNSQKNDVIAFAFRDQYFNDGKNIAIKDAYQIFNYLILVTDKNDGCINCNPYDLFLIESDRGQQAMVISTGISFWNLIILQTNDKLKLNQSTDGSASNGNSGSGNSGGNSGSGNVEKKKSILAKCAAGSNGNNCFNYDGSVVAKKVYLVGYNVTVDGTLTRISYGNNTGANADNQIQKQPIADHIQNFQIKYLLDDGTFTDDPSNGNTDQEKLNHVVQIEVSITVEVENNENGVSEKEPITLTSTFSTRNLKYDID